MLHKSKHERYESIFTTIINEIENPTLKLVTARFNEINGTNFSTAYTRNYLEDFGLLDKVYRKASGSKKENFKRGNGFHYKVLFQAPLYSKLKGLYSSTDALWRTFTDNYGNYYAVCNKSGRVARYDTKDEMWYDMRIHRNNSGYCQVALYRRNLCLVHILVYRAFNETFEGECVGKDIDHIDCNRMNCNADNLRLLTHRENAIRRYRKEECKLF